MKSGVSNASEMGEASIKTENVESSVKNSDCLQSHHTTESDDERCMGLPEKQLTPRVDNQAPTI